MTPEKWSSGTGLRHRLQSAVERIWYQGRGEPGYWSDLLLAPVLHAASVIFRCILAARRLAYKIGLRRIHRLPVPVISVGSLLVGGVGKTQVVIHVATLIAQMRKRAVVVLRGYGGRASYREVVVSDGEAVIATSRDAGDEAVELARRLPGIPVVIGADRVRAAHLALARFKPDVIIVDDGFQHVRLARTLDIAVWDAGARTRSFHLVPRGPFREPLAALDRAHAVFTVGQNPSTVPVAPRPIRGTPLVGFTRAASFHGRDGALVAAPTGPVKLMTTIANPERVATTLAAAGIAISQAVAFPDHHRPTARELAALERDAVPGATIVVTEKDVVKLPADWPVSARLVVVRATLSLIGTSGASLRALLRETLDGRPPKL